MSVLSAIGMFAVIVSAIEALAFCVLLYQGMDKRNGLAWHMLSLFGVIGGVLALTIVRRILGLSADHGWFAWANTLFFCLIPVVFGWRLAILLGFRRRKAG